MQPSIDRADLRLERVTLAEQTAEILKNHIIWGDEPPGTRLIETELAERLGISRTPVRQALQRLESDGLAVRQGWGLVVAPFDFDVAVETLIIRELLEPFAARESAPHLGKSELARLRSILGKMASAQEKKHPSPKQGVKLNLEFHSLLNSRCRYPRIVETIQAARDAPSAMRLYSSYTREDLRRVQNEHAAIVEAAAAAAEGRGTADCVATLIAEHMRAARRALLRNTGSEAQGERGPGAFEVDASE